MTTQATLETWEMKALRLAQELKALRAETEFAPSDDKRWRQWTPRYRTLRDEINRHMREVPA